LLQLSIDRELRRTRAVFAADAEERVARLVQPPQSELPRPVLGA
jgi:hypothetical protein